MRLLLNRKNDMQGIKNLTHGPINRQLFNLAMPIMATSLICWNMRNVSRFILNFCPIRPLAMPFTKEATVPQA